MDHVLQQTYLSLADVTRFLKGLLKTKKLVGKDPCAFWRGVNFLDIQERGNSQTEMAQLFDAILKEKYDFGINECAVKSAVYVYLDDGIFTGNRVGSDLEKWIKTQAPDEAKVHIVTIALHTHGKYYAEGRLKQTATYAKKSIDFSWWKAIKLEDRKAYTNSSDVLRPDAIPDDNAVQAYVAAMKHPPHLRTAGQVGDNTIFSSNEGRQVLEQEFLKAGVRIRKKCPNLNEYQRPLGNSVLEPLGFGSLGRDFPKLPKQCALGTLGRRSHGIRYFREPPTPKQRSNGCLRTYWRVMASEFVPDAHISPRRQHRLPEDQRGVRRSIQHG